MAELHDLKPSEGSTKNRKRVGRGPGSGLGKTSGRGHKGQNSRSGGKVGAYFEGGQMPLIRRIPKRGFKNIHRVEYQIVNVRDLDRCDGEATPETLQAAGLIASAKKRVKILGQGELEKKLDVSAHKFSKSAQAKIEAAGGSVTVIAISVAAPAVAEEPVAEAAAEPVVEEATEEAPAEEAAAEEEAVAAEAEAADEPEAGADEDSEADAEGEEE